jgi:hypothetical protein
MVAASAVNLEPDALEPDAGGVIEVWTIEATGDTVRASGPRLQIWAGMRLGWRYLDGRGVPRWAEVHVLDAVFKSDSRSALTLQVVAVTPDRASRKHARLPVSGSVLLTAVNCDRIVDRDQVHAALQDLSVSGVALVTHDGRVRSGDRLALRIRFMEGTLDAQVRVARVSQGAAGGAILLGASFIEPTQDLLATAERVMERFGTHRPSDGEQPTRHSLGLATERNASGRDVPGLAYGSEPAVARTGRAPFG